MCVEFKMLEYIAQIKETHVNHVRVCGSEFNKKKDVYETISKSDDVFLIIFIHSGVALKKERNVT
jgi:hypothetical protein